MSPGSARYWGDMGKSPLLRAPPFPGSAPVCLSEQVAAGESGPGGEAVEDCLAAMKALRVGGTFWAARPALPAAVRVIARPATAAQAGAMRERAEADNLAGALCFWLPEGNDISVCGNFPAVIGDCDPWHLFAQAQEVWTGEGDETGLIALLAGCTLRCWGGADGRSPGEWSDPAALGRALLFERRSYRDPFTGSEVPAARIVALLGQWRRLIDANRPIAAAFGFAFWKQDTAQALLWGGEGLVPFRPARPDALPSPGGGGAVALWKARVPADFLDRAERSGLEVLEVEDGFIRSAGLGADCVPPLSIVVDALAPHYDPGRPSGLENLLNEGGFDPELLERAEALRRLILRSGVSKYGVGGGASARRRGGNKVHVLVTGQVEDDRSVLFGGGGVTGNLDLLRRVRALAPDAYIIYRPHPDVDAGHRKGHVPDAEALAVADEIARGTPITALIDMADHVHVLTSLAGFEALLREKPVTTHGVPFYAGWGLTTDLGPVPARRRAKRSLAELVAATLLVYPRYLDPVTGLPCPPEILIERLASGVRRENRAIVPLRRLQGVAARTIGRLFGRRAVGKGVIGS